MDSVVSGYPIRESRRRMRLGLGVIDRSRYQWGPRWKTKMCIKEFEEA